MRVSNDEDLWKLSDEDFSEFLDSLRTRRLRDHTVTDPAMRALTTERALRRAGREMKNLHMLVPVHDTRLLIAAEQLRFIAEHLAEEPTYLNEALIWLETARNLIRTTRRLIDEITSYG
jgi:hypothetical protein